MRVESKATKAPPPLGPLDGGAGGGPELSDCELVYAVAAEDREALAALYDRHAPRLLALAERLMQSRIDAEDLVHDLFIEVLYRASTYDKERGSVLSWLVVRLRSRAIDRLRSPAYRRRVALDAAGEPKSTAGQALDAAEISDSDPLPHSLQRAMSELPQDTQQILELVYFKGLSLKEVSDRLEMPLGTVKSRLHRALRSLRGVVIDSPGGGSRR